MSNKILSAHLVWAHPRLDSLTAQIVADTREVITAAGYDLDEVDLYRMGFDPSLKPTDEPDWNSLDKQYSPETMELAQRASQADALIFVFPVWWYSFPAIMKGYVDRVWNYGQFYGEGRRIGVNSVLWVGLVGYPADAFKKRHYDVMMSHYLNVGIAGYCGFTDTRVEFLYNTLGEEIDDMPAYVETLRAQSRTAISGLLDRLIPQGCSP